jgi:Xaa-Pro aminopeptidase
MDDRLGALRAAMQERGVDVVVVGPTANLRYLLGYDALAVERITVLLVARDTAVMLMPDFDVREFREQTGFEPVVGWADKRGPAPSVAEALALLGELPERPRVAFDDELRFSFLLDLGDALWTDRPLLASELFTPLRLVKRPEEQEGIARACELVSQGIDAMVERARPGMTERQLAAELDGVLRGGGADSVDFVLVCAGPNAASPHHSADATPLREGEPVLCDIGVRLDGYYGDITQQVFLGEPTEEYRRHYDVVAAAQEAGVQAARAGATAGDVDAAASQVIADAGLAEWSGPRTGHGLGLDIHEAPSVVAGDATELRPGVVITIEPGIYIPGSYGIRIEDTVLVTDGDAKRLTRGARPLQSKPV